LIKEIFIDVFNVALCLMIIVRTLIVCLQCSIITGCEPLTDPTNGAINCELGGNGVPTVGDTCSYTCNDDYELTGNEMRTCQSDGSWSGNDNACSRGVLQKYLWYIL